MGVAERIDNVQALFLLPLELMTPKESLKKAIRANEFSFVDENTKQLARGEDAGGKSLGRYKNFNYKGRFEPVDLKLTSDFWSAFTIEVNDKHTEIFSQDVKSPMLVKKYGKDIFGLQKESLNRVGDELKDDFFTDCRRKIFRK